MKGLASPGLPGGPCLDENCGHADCAVNRALAARKCSYCGEPIGYEREFIWFTSQEPQHKECFEQALDRR